MSRAKTNKLYRTFTKGLITEAGYLTYPEDASIDELNTIISRKGNRTRRLGIDYEDDYVFTDVDLDVGDAINDFVWVSADKAATFNFLVIQIGHKVHFWSMDSVPVSDNKKSFTIDLLPYKAPTTSDLEVATIFAQFDAGAGYLFIAHPLIEPLLVEYNHLTDTFNVIRVIIQIRDLEGIYDELANDEEPGALSIEHHYNLLNQGWLAPGTIPAPALADGEVPPSGTGPGGGTTGGGGGGSGTSGGGGGTGGTYINPYTGNEVVIGYGGGTAFRKRFDEEPVE